MGRPEPASEVTFAAIVMNLNPVESYTVTDLNSSVFGNSPAFRPAPAMP